MNLRENPVSVYSSRQTGLMNAPAPDYRYENTTRNWVPLPVIPQNNHPSITEARQKIQEYYDFGDAQANRNAYAGSQYDPPNFHRSLEKAFAYQFPPEDEDLAYGYKNIFRGAEYYTSTDPIDRAYQISRKTNCMGGAPRLPGLLPCPYGTDAVACAYHAA